MRVFGPTVKKQRKKKQRAAEEAKSALGEGD